MSQEIPRDFEPSTSTPDYGAGDGDAGDVDTEPRSEPQGGPAS